LAEEPDYRLKIIHTMPSISLLDRHMVTPEERIKAAKLFETSPAAALSKSHSSKRNTTAPASTLKKNNFGSGFSKGERDLYREVSTLRRHEEDLKKRLEAERADFYRARTYVGIPVPSKKAENKSRFGNNREEALDEWEKNQVKRMFRADFDRDKTGMSTSKEEFRRFMAKLAADECIIGKVPNLSEGEIEALAEGWAS
jgi:hypothetical protein